LINCVLENANGETHPPGESNVEEEEAILAVTGKVILYNC